MLLSGILEDGGGRWLGWKGGGCGSNMAYGALPKLTALPQEEKCSNLRTLWQVWPDYYGYRMIQQNGLLAPRLRNTSSPTYSMLSHVQTISHNTTSPLSTLNDIYTVPLTSMLNPRTYKHFPLQFPSGTYYILSLVRLPPQANG